MVRTQHQACRPKIVSAAILLCNSIVMSSLTAWTALFTNLMKSMRQPGAEREGTHARRTQVATVPMAPVLAIEAAR
jgi:hypothetical protein